MAVPMDADVGRIVAGKYHLERLVGQGGMGEVWRARHVSLGEPIAIKVLRVADGEDEMVARERFEQEARIAAKLSRKSRHVVSVVDQGEESGTPFLVMELLEGEALEDVLERAGVVPIPLAATIITQVARGLLHAHAEGVVHRDLKPANIFITNDEDDRTLVKVLDFGIAKVMERRTDAQKERKRLTKRNMVVGTPSYMSPEQMRGVRKLGPQCDVWALATIAYEMLAGQPPFVGEMREVMDNHAKGNFPRVTSLRSDAPPEVDEVFTRAFAPDMSDRYPSAIAFANAFARALGHESDEQEPTVVTPKSDSKKKWLAFAAAILLVGGIGTAIVMGTSTPKETIPTSAITLPMPPATQTSVAVTHLPTANTVVVPPPPVVTTIVKVVPALATSATSSAQPAPSSSFNRSEIF